VFCFTCIKIYKILKGRVITWSIYSTPPRKFSAEGDSTPDAELNQEDFDANLANINISNNTKGQRDASASNSSPFPDGDISKLKGLRIANLNVNSLTRHVDDIRIMLTNYPFYILAINETKLDSSISDSEIYINGYTIIRKDRNRNGGGIAIYIKNNISHFERVDLTLDSGNLELICIEINRLHCRPFLLRAWYRPPNSEIELFDNLELFLFKCDIENKELILIGDINCDYMKVSLDPHSRRLQFLCSLYQLSQLVDEPTRVTDTSSTLIYLILTNRPENILSTGVIHLGISDHSLIYAGILLIL
jgi:hypothetical protein